MKHIVILVLLLIPAIVFASQTSTVCHNELAAWINENRPLAIVDIQTPAGFKEHNYTDSIPTGNNPLRLKKTAEKLKSSKGRIVVVSKSGGNDAINARETLAQAGVKRSRILILEGGMEAASSKASCDCCKPASKQTTLK
ncbi:MAG: rhodanese-like domain-containing protein [Geobacteraceae bacterium]|nr:rhodanese-like domain-containing protein [Geobacteraceae bacterium]